MKKKVFVLFMAAVMAFSAAACGKSEDTENEAAETAVDETEGEEEDSGPDVEEVDFTPTAIVDNDQFYVEATSASIIDGIYTLDLKAEVRGEVEVDEYTWCYIQVIGVNYEGYHYFKNPNDSQPGEVPSIDVSGDDELFVNGTCEYTIGVCNAEDYPDITAIHLQIYGFGTSPNLTQSAFTLYPDGNEVSASEVEDTVPVMDNDIAKAVFLNTSDTLGGVQEVAYFYVENKSSEAWGISLGSIKTDSNSISCSDVYVLPAGASGVCAFGCTLTNTYKLIVGPTEYIYFDLMDNGDECIKAMADVDLTAE